MRQVLPILLGCLFCLVSAVVLHGEPVSPEPLTPVVACADCNDNNSCTLDSCGLIGGVCQHDLQNCDDGNPCTLDSCDAATGCVSVPLPAGTACDDGAACTSGDVCDESARCAGTVIDSRPPDGDGDGVTNTCDDCPAASNASQIDADHDGVGDVCDNCPMQYNPGQNPDDCLQAAHELTVSRSSAAGKGSGTISWTTTHEFDISGFNVEGQEHDGTYTRLNSTPIPCLQCVTGKGAAYVFTIPKLKSGRNLYVQVLGGTGDLIGIFGPAPDPGDRAGLTRD